MPAFLAWEQLRTVVLPKSGNWRFQEALRCGLGSLPSRRGQRPHNPGSVAFHAWRKRRNLLRRRRPQRLFQVGLNIGHVFQTNRKPHVIRRHTGFRLFLRR